MSDVRLGWLLRSVVLVFMVAAVAYVAASFLLEVAT